jgi:hypothetical protein
MTMGTGSNFDLDADHVVGLSLFKYNNQLVLTWRARQEADLHAAPVRH